MSDERQEKPSHFRWFRWLLFLGVIAVVATLLIPQRPPADYRFLTASRPIDVMTDGGGRWFYYTPDVPQGSAPQFAMRVRAELLAQGFTEDLSNQPWFRFVKGAREVIVCNHDEIATAPTSVFGVRVNHEKTYNSEKWPVLWFREPGSDPIGFTIFKAKKLVFRW